MKRDDEVSHVNLSKLSSLFKIAENINFLRHAFLKPEKAKPK